MIERETALPQRLVWSVAGLVHAVADALAGRFSACTVRGELSAFSRAPSGHCYFCLKDADGQAVLIRCAMFRRAASLLDFVPADGQVVELRGRLTMYEPRGELQFVAESMRPAGTGALFEQFLRLKAKLESEGLFDASRKRAPQPYPRRLGLVTSPAAAALHDVLSSLARRAPHVEVVLYPSAVQGPDAPAGLVRALSTAGRRTEVDTIILCRGGGSLEDLWAFNDERVVRAVAASPIPVVCGVGHETDVTLADFAADLRAPTPTAAAELVAPTRDACIETLDAIMGRLQRRIREALDLQAQRLDRSALRLARPGQALRAQRERLALLEHRLADQLPRTLQLQHGALNQFEGRLRRSLQSCCQTHQQRLEALAGRLRALDPRQVLARGYAWLGDASGRPVGSVQQLSVGAALQAVLHDGTADVVVTGVAGRRDEA